MSTDNLARDLPTPPERLLELLSADSALSTDLDRPRLATYQSTGEMSRNVGDVEPSLQQLLVNRRFLVQMENITLPDLLRLTNTNLILI